MIKKKPSSKTASKMNHPKIELYVDAIHAYKAGITCINNTKHIKHRMSSNENPLGQSEKIIKAATFQNIERYPDTTQAKAKKELANAHKLKTKNLMFGNGSDEFLYLICKLFLNKNDECIICEHSFLLYKLQIQAVNAIPVIIKETNNKININVIINSINKNTKLIFITMPTNPNGSFLSLRELNTLKNTIPNHILLLIDSAYAEYVINDRYDDGKTIIDKNNIIMIRTFSKLYGLAGIRIGWMHANIKYIKAINKIKNPFNVNKIAQKLAALALHDKSFCEKSIDFNLFWITKIIATAKTVGLSPIYSSANFVTIGFKKKLPIQFIEKYISTKNLIVRNISNYKMYNSIRSSLGLAKANQKLIQTLKNLR